MRIGLQLLVKKQKLRLLQQQRRSGNKRLIPISRINDQRGKIWRLQRVFSHLSLMMALGDLQSMSFDSILLLLGMNEAILFNVYYGSHLISNMIFSMVRCTQRLSLLLPVRLIETDLEKVFYFHFCYWFYKICGVNTYLYTVEGSILFFMILKKNTALSMPWLHHILILQIWRLLGLATQWLLSSLTPSKNKWPSLQLSAAMLADWACFCRVFYCLFGLSPILSILV